MVTGWFVALDFTTIVFLKSPFSEVLYLTLIVPDFPGKIGFREKSGIVHPQEDDALEIIRGSLPVLRNVKKHHPSSPCSIVS